MWLLVNLILSIVFASLIGVLLIETEKEQKVSRRAMLPLWLLVAMAFLKFIAADVLVWNLRQSQKTISQLESQLFTL